MQGKLRWSATLLRVVLWAITAASLAGIVTTALWMGITRTGFSGRAGGIEGNNPLELRLHLPTVIDLTPGENRLVFGFTDRNGRLLTDKDISDATVMVHGLRGQEDKMPQAVRAQYLKPGWREVSKATYYHDPHVLMDGFFKATVRFIQPGQWDLEFIAHRPGKEPFSQRVFPNVLSESLTPAVGARAPRSRNPTLKDVAGDLSKLDSDRRLNDVEMHRVSIAEAIIAGRPAIVLFSTPGFCETRMCLPNTEIVYSLYPEYGDRVEFIHIEIYQNYEKYQDQIFRGTLESEPRDLELRDAVAQWGLQNDPWLFFIDRRGRIFAKFFGPIARSEVEETLKRLLEQGK